MTTNTSTFTVTTASPLPISRFGIEELSISEIDMISGGVTAHGACMAAAAATGFVLGAGAVVAVSLTPQGEAAWSAAMIAAIAGDPAPLAALAGIAGGIIVGTTAGGAGIGEYLCPAEPDPTPPPPKS